MRILYITGGFPYPLTSGFLRQYHLIRGLAPRHEIDLVSSVGRGFVPDDVAGIQPFVGRVETVQDAHASGSRIVKGLRRLRDTIVPSASHEASRALGLAVRRLVRENDYDVALLSGRRVETIPDELRGIPLVVDLCDATELRLLGSLPYSGALHRMMIRLELAWVSRVERGLASAASHVLFASERDRDLFDAGGAAWRSVVVPNGVDLDFWQRSEPQLGQNLVVFSGAMRYRPNEDAAIHLVRAIMPLVWAAEPQVSVAIVGRDPTSTLRRAVADPRVAVTGFVDDMRPYLQAGSVYAAPLRFASGIQNKLLEAMAMEMPIVTSPVAAAGVQVADGVQAPLTVAHDPAGFASAIISAIRAARADPRPASVARQYVGDRFTWAAAVETLEGVMTAREAGRR